MSDTKHAPYASILTGLSTELNALANGANSAAGPVLDNTTALNIFADVELVLPVQGVARSAGAVVNVYLLASADDTNYPDVNEVCVDPWTTFQLDAAVTARRITKVDRPIPPGLYKIFARNITGGAFPATLVTVRLRPHSLRNV